jgi:hypothetical protein
MLNQPDRNRRRPVDALFGDNPAQPTPNYIVDPPQPANDITPPILDETESFTAPPAPPESETRPASEPVLEPASASPVRPDEARFLTLSFQIERLYDDVKSQLHDSPQVTNYCFDLLLQARQAYERRDYARAEFFIQSTDAKLKRSLASAQATRRPIVWALWAWEIIAFIIGASIVALSYVTGLTLFGLPVANEFIILLRALGWGMIGGVIGALSNFTRYVQQRDYDPAYEMHYFARPLIGALLGLVLFVLSQAGILAGNLIIGDFKVGPIFLYVFAILAGFKQEYVTDFFDNLMKTIFKSK